MSEISSRWIERLFARLQVRYGSAWTAKWAGIDPDAVKADWEQVLGASYRRCPESLVYALDHLPQFPPNSTDFLSLCMGYQAPAQRLAAPFSKPDPKMLATIAAALQKPEGFDYGKRCAEQLRARLKRDGKLGYVQRAQLAALEAIGK
jgi:hypothetical protein